MTPRRVFPALLFSLLLVGPATGQTERPETKQAKAWPAFSKDKTRKLLTLVQSLGRKNQTPAKIADLEKRIVAMGAGGCHILIRRIKDKQPTDIKPSLYRILDQLLAGEHQDLLARYYKSSEKTRKAFILSRLQRYKSKRHLKLFQKAIKTKDPQLVFYGHLALARLQMDDKALQYLFKLCTDEWRRVGNEVIEALADIRGGEAMMWLKKFLMNKDAFDKMTGLRWMRSLATKEFAGYIGGYLDEDDAAIRKEAINTLRVVVDGKPALPLSKISVFELNKLKKKWKKRL